MNLTIITRLMLASLLATSLFATACGNGDDDSEDTDSVVTGNNPTDRCPGATPMSLASRITLSGTIEGTPGKIDEPGKVEFFNLTLDAPIFVRIATKSVPTMTDEGIYFNPVLQLYNADGTELLATSDDAFLYGAPILDAEVLYNVPEATTLCVAVQDWTSWVEYETLIGQDDFNYDVNATDIALHDAITIDAGNNDDVANAQDLEMVPDSSGAAFFGQACGTIDSASDVDVYSFSPNMFGEYIVNGLVLQSGPGASGMDVAMEGTGSTLAEGRMSRLDATDAYYTSVLFTDSHYFESPSTDSKFYVSVELADGASPGANDFYCIYYLAEPAMDIWTEIEGTDPGNDSGSAVPLEFEQVSGINPYVLLKGDIDSSTGTDIDWYAFEVEQAGAPYALVCTAKYKGSGLINATFEIQDSAGTVIRTGVETDGLVMWNEHPDSADGLLFIPTSGTHYLVVSAEGQDPEILGTHYTCRLQLY